MQFGFQTLEKPKVSSVCFQTTSSKPANPSNLARDPFIRVYPMFDPLIAHLLLHLAIPNGPSAEQPESSQSEDPDETVAIGVRVQRQERGFGGQ
jgi:hypothetical protein